jgi:hypothetical protein
MAEQQAHPPSGATAALSGEVLGDGPGTGQVLTKILGAFLPSGPRLSS